MKDVVNLKIYNVVFEEGFLRWLPVPTRQFDRLFGQGVGLHPLVSCTHRYCTGNMC
jgi:hypothetical protein